MSQVLSVHFILKRNATTLAICENRHAQKRQKLISSLLLRPVRSVLKCHMLVFILVDLLLGKGDLCLHMLMGEKIEITVGWKSSVPFTFVVTVLELGLLGLTKN